MRIAKSSRMETCILHRYGRCEMFVLYIFTILAIGQPEHRTQLETYETYKECTDAKVNIWAQMNAAYPKEEQKLYRFDCALLEA